MPGLSISPSLTSGFKFILTVFLTLSGFLASKLKKSQMEETISVSDTPKSVYVSVRARACVRACVRVCVCVCVRARAI